ncbi:hypothetical protein PIB30_020597 [Stylosanthes scabra]|uniref:Uncharacterized protein n=1 Tax=Stylosanthes scabra TaxID=79078 RepID=A0ABU6R8X1_9FABA|nr:hypothetical protein [Stylosanthes scabra]
MKFDIEKFDGKMFFGLWQVQVKDVLIQSGFYKMRKVWAYKRYCPGGASSAKGFNRQSSERKWLKRAKGTERLRQDLEGHFWTPCVRDD